MKENVFKMEHKQYRNKVYFSFLYNIKKIELDVKMYANAFISNRNFLKLLMYVPCNRVNRKHSIPSTQNSEELEQ